MGDDCSWSPEQPQLQRWPSGRTSGGPVDRSPQSPRASLSLSFSLVPALLPHTQVFYFSFVISFVGDLLHSSNRGAERLRLKLEAAEAWMKVG